MQQFRSLFEVDHVHLPPKLRRSVNQALRILLGATVPTTIPTTAAMSSSWMRPRPTPMLGSFSADPGPKLYDSEDHGYILILEEGDDLSWDFPMLGEGAAPSRPEGRPVVAVHHFRAGGLIVRRGNPHDHRPIPTPMPMPKKVRLASG